MNRGMSWFEIGLDRWNPNPKRWKILEKKYDLEVRVEDDNYSAWKEELGIYISTMAEGEEICGYYGVITFAPFVTVKQLCEFLDAFWEATDEGTNYMEISNGINSTSFCNHEDWLVKLMELKREIA